MDGKTVAPQPVNGLSACLLPGCGNIFHPSKRNQRFCIPAHKAEFYRLAYEKGVKAMNGQGMHFARLDNSARLQRVLEVLLDGAPHSTLEIQKRAEVCAVGSTVGELRRNGYLIDCNYAGRTTMGRIYEYKLRN